MEVRPLRDEQGGDEHGPDGPLAANAEQWVHDRVLRQVQRQANVQQGELRLSHKGEPIHWKCPDCKVACRCVGAVRDLPHKRCGRAPGSGPAYDPPTITEETE